MTPLSYATGGPWMIWPRSRSSAECNATRCCTTCKQNAALDQARVPYARDAVPAAYRDDDLAGLRTPASARSPA